ncbi:MAG: MBL fold metallo-hydrolase [Melioribacteraceae bacterium]|nr:MBL fold metallo-hydrolase [Melioribacteraceae bacterium]MCF8353115.1 MBL fold metallo-hydrolase [Melioribacteraceae bacterium]MCF8392739.1 MBL fold metallo-hydrolase [Melioribacteraceae bacterium]MCF8418270.1 MBL fold metallo-hydrolase [Melioribacteraceae bacterium]
MKIKFVGAAKSVTGSMHLIETNGKKFLLDCGLYQGKRKEAFELNRNFDEFDPAEIDFVILSHAHIDHSGNLPTLVRNGFKGNIYCTFATRDLAQVMLRDSAHIQEKDVEFVNKKRKKHGKNLFEPLYTDEDAHKALKLFVGVNYNHEFPVAEGIVLTFFDAGHILGSASVFLQINENGRIIHFGFTGDLGRPNLPILKDPVKIPDVEYLISESTYGGRFHDNPIDTEKRLVEIIKKAIERRAKIIVPAFSVGRTQEIVFALNSIFDEGKVERIPIYVDSPLSVNATEVFRLHPECFDNDTAQFLIKHQDPFGFYKLTYISDVEDSKRLNEVKGPLMIISSSGMCEAGRILHHLRNNIEDPNNIILIVGYSAEHTLGRRIVERDEFVKIFGEEFKLNAEVIVMNSFSAHADSNELVDYLNKFDKSRMQNLFLVHGDFDQQEKLKNRLTEIGFNKITIPERGDEVEI